MHRLNKKLEHIILGYILLTVVVDLLYPPYFYLSNKFFAQANSLTPGDLSNKSLS